MRNATILMLALFAPLAALEADETFPAVSPDCKEVLPVPPGESEYPLLVTKRMHLQSRFSVLQSKLYADPNKAPDSAHQDMEKLIKEVVEFQQQYLAFEDNRTVFWNNPGYWGKLWTRTGAGSVRYLVEKLVTQIAKVRGMQINGVAPFKREDLNATQKMLDGIREGLSIDRDIGVAANVLK
jgi:hypothetical protein